MVLFLVVAKKGIFSLENTWASEPFINSHSKTWTSPQQPDTNPIFTTSVAAEQLLSAGKMFVLFVLIAQSGKVCVCSAKGMNHLLEQNLQGDKAHDSI